MEDFIFGTLSTDRRRLKRLRTERMGLWHGSSRFPRDPLPGQPVELQLIAGPETSCSEAWVYYSVDGSEPSGELGVARQGMTVPMSRSDVDWDLLDWGYRQTYCVTLPGQPAGTVVRYRFSGRRSDGRDFTAESGKVYAYCVDDFSPPGWAQEALLYHIFLDRFNPGKGRMWTTPDTLAGFFGGTLQGVLERLDYLEGLGVNTLYLSPIFPSATHHGYDATDYFNVEPRLGTLVDFRNLASEAHRRNMHLILDFVPNHWSDNHPTFQEAIRDPRSPYRGWYSFQRYPTRYDSFFGVRCMPKVNLLNPGARNYMLDAARFWLAEGADGFRLDHAIGPTPDFWADFRRATREVKPDCWSFGEVPDSAECMLAFEGLLDGCLDFLLLEAFRQTFAFHTWDLNHFAQFVQRHQAYFPPAYTRPSFMDNHDMDRFLWAAEGDTRRLKLAALCQFTLSGPPLIYYGTEIGLTQEHGVHEAGRGFGVLEEARLPMLWDERQDRDMYAFYRALADVRKSHPAIAHGSWRLVQSSKESLVYLREREGDRVLVAINRAEVPACLALEDRWLRIACQSGEAHIEPNPGNGFNLTLGAMTGVVLVEGRP